MKNLLLCALGCLLFCQAQAETLLNHIHLNVPDGQAAVEWYQKLLGGEVRNFPPGPALQIGAGLLMTQKSKAGNVLPSRGGAIDHFAVSIANVGDKVSAARAMGATVLVPAGKRNGKMTAIISDPWGTSVELLNDTARRGIHHLHFAASDPDALQTWLLQIFGGRKGSVRKGDDRQIDYGNFAILISRARDVQPSLDRALDHVALQVTDLTALTAQLKASGYTPGDTRPGAEGSTLMFFVGPAGVRLEAISIPARQ
jgi:catechol 2,3-dioxygenase-like lactoylglutathione lyase family enzyme